MASAAAFAWQARTQRASTSPTLRRQSGGPRRQAAIEHGFHLLRQILADQRQRQFAFSEIAVQAFSACATAGSPQ
jgi:hypothetical protein